MIQRVITFFFHSIKGRTMLNVAIIHAIIMGIAIYDLNRRQKEFMQQEQTKKGVELSSILAANAADAMLRNDIVALDELIQELSSVKNISATFLLDANGRVKTSTDKSYFNLTLSDPISVNLLKEAQKNSLKKAQSVHNHLIDTLYPITVSGETIGYARTLLSNKELEMEFGEMSQNGFIYALIAIFSGSFLAFLMIKRMSEDIDALSEAAKRISKKDFDTPMPIIKGKSEIANMAHAFDVMMESIRQNIHELQKSEEKMKWQATHDALTGLNNRINFEKALNTLIEESKIFHSTHALLFLDLDKFKVVNDTAGHLAGDELLKNIAQIMQKSIRQQDLLFRFGGDEFGILLKNCDTAHASAIGQKIIAAVDGYEFKWYAYTFRVGVSIGIVSIDDASNDAVETLSLADTACYIAKDKGRNRIFLASESNKESMEQREEMSWIARIRDALANNKFELYVQKIESLKDGLATHYETLLRLNTPDGKIALPDSFLPAAERYALMPSIDLWVARRLFEYINANKTSQVENRCFSLNLSGQSINDEDFLPKLKALLREYNIAGETIIFEITESVAIASHARANEFINELREFKCLFALDDFGSGASSFTYLKSFTVDYLKIDGSFIKNILSSHIDEAFVEAVTSIANKMDMLVIAEYVENEEIRQKMEDMGVHYAQGFGIERPFAIKALSLRG